MDIIRRLFCRKLYNEYLQFKRELLRQSKEEIFGSAYRIDIMISIYEILLEKAESLPERVLWVLLIQPDILERFYAEWMKKDDGFYEELQQHVEEELPEADEELLVG